MTSRTRPRRGCIGTTHSGSCIVALRVEHVSVTASRVSTVQGHGYVRLPSRSGSCTIEPVKQLKREQRFDEALEPLLECIDVVERPAVTEGGVPALWYTEQVAIVYRKRKDAVERAAALTTSRFLSAQTAGGRSAV